MRALAEFVMRGRRQAIGAAVLGAPLPLLNLLSSAIAALVLLRRGPGEGVVIIAWICLPLAAVCAITRDPGPFVILFGTGAMAWVLRATLSWELAMVTAVMAAAAGTLILVFTAPELVDLWANMYMKVMQETSGSGKTVTADEARQVFAGFFAMGQAWIMLSVLILARWWQSVLYNPDGFRKEFHQLRLSPWLAAIIVILMTVSAFADGPALRRWVVPVLTVPLVLSALGLLHWTVSYNKLSPGWLVGFYVLLVPLLKIFFPLLVATSLMDSWFDVRKRIEREV